MASDDMTPERARRLLADATPGEWRRAHHGTWEVEAPPYQLLADCGEIGRSEHDAALMAAAPDLARAYLAAEERAQRAEAALAEAEEQGARWMRDAAMDEVYAESIGCVRRLDAAEVCRQAREAGDA
jgi:hypothetical protein